MACVKLSTAEYTKLAKNGKSTWNCGRDDCVNHAKQPFNVLIEQLSKLTGKINELSSKMDTLTPLPGKIDQIIQDIDKLNKNLSSLDERVSTNEAKIGKLEDSIINGSSALNASDSESLMAEFNDRVRRASNVMVYGLVESTSPNSNARKISDLELVTSLFKSSQPNFNNSGVKLFRVGKTQGDKPRPLKVVLNSEYDARLVLSTFSHDSASKVNTIFSSVKVARDKTPQEQKYLKSLVAEMENRKSKGEDDLTIKFKNNIPSIVKVPKNE